MKPFTNWIGNLSAINNADSGDIPETGNTSSSDGHVRLTRRRILSSIATIGVAGAASGAGTMALFSDAETSADNMVQAGTLDLKLGGVDQNVSFLGATNVRPGEDGAGEVDIENHGSLPGQLEIELSNIYTVDRSGSTPGHLHEYLEVQAEIGTTEIMAREPVSDLEEGLVSESEKTIPDGESATFTLNWWLLDGTKNKARGDEVRLDFTFRLVQGGSS